MLKIERDKVYIDGCGNRFRVVCVDATTEACGYPVIGISDAGGVRTFTSEGVFQIDHQSERDLVREVKEKKVCYINVYPDGSFLHASRPRADEAAPTRVTCRRIARIRVEYEEGQFDD